MKFLIFRFHKSPLYLAVEKENMDIIELLLSHPDIDVNFKNISNYILFNTIQITFFSTKFLNYYFEKV